ncbi:hypothetical protein [Xenophilus sp. Marseille-Q4582]|uniref:hypothetical protein n=1 Tax=Xenophilus sp. Marseille-Q4582 TaxID=2866600 RepID=UPI001CE45527|nr:hypothetical protein [Xenophilus sp. Marseille-Q4582]
MSWTDDSAAWIAEQVKAHPDMSKAELEKHCRKNYPFCERRGWAYKAWLKAMRTYFRPQSMRPVRAGKTEPSPEELERRGQQRLIA